MTAPRSFLRLAEFSPRCTVLGPGVRAVVWVQGCPLRCPGCITPEYLPETGGELVSVSRLAERILDLDDLDGVTFSGGEPFAQADALADLVELLREGRDLSVMAYSGFRIEHLRERGGPERRLLAGLDLLVDGTYQRERHADLRWRGSSNQRLHILTERHQHLLAEPDVSAGLEVAVRQDGALDPIGVPPVPDFRDRFFDHLASAGIRFDDMEDQ